MAALPVEGFVQPVEVVVGGTLPRAGFVQPIENAGGGGGIVTGSGAAGQVTFWTGAHTVSGSAGLTWNDTTRLLTVTGTVGAQQSWVYDATHHVEITVDIDSHTTFSIGNRMLVRAQTASTPSSVWRDVGLRFAVQGDDGANGGTFIGVQNAFSALTECAEVDGYKAYGTLAVPLAVPASARLYRLASLAYDGTSFFFGGSLDFYATENFVHGVGNGTMAQIWLTGTGTTSIFSNFQFKDSVFTVYRNTGLNEFLTIGWGGTEWDIIADKSAGGSARTLALASYSNVDIYAGGIAGANKALQMPSAGGVTVLNGSLKIPNGTAAVPGLIFTTATTTGLSSSGVGHMTVSVSATAVTDWDSSFGLVQRGDWPICFTSAIGSNPDIQFGRDSAGVSYLKNGTANAQTLRIYGTTTGPKYLSLAHDATNGTIDVSASSGNITIGGNATSITFSSALRAANGAAATPSYSFTNATGTGILLANASAPIQMDIANGGVIVWRYDSAVGHVTRSDWGINWTNGAVTGTVDVQLIRDGASGVLAQKVGATAQTHRIYGTTTGPKYLSLSHNATNALIDTSASSGAIFIGTASASSVQIGAATISLALFGTGSFGSGSGVLFVGNANTNPSTNPTGGGVLYSNAGAGTWRGSGGTITPFGPAGPHCEKCGYDEWTVATLNTVWKSWRFECGHCGAVYAGGPKDVLRKLPAEHRGKIIRGTMKFEEIEKLVA